MKEIIWIEAFFQKAKKCNFTIYQTSIFAPFPFSLKKTEYPSFTSQTKK